MELELSTIKRKTCAYLNVEIQMLNDKTRARKFVQARQIIHYFAKKYTNLSIRDIGAEVGLKDHATVIYSIKTVQNLIDTDKKFRTVIKDIDNSLQTKSIHKISRIKQFIRKQRQIGANNLY